MFRASAAPHKMQLLMPGQARDLSSEIN